MATFPENLATIQNAVLGEDMRQAIHDAVEQAYDHGSEIMIDSALSNTSENPVQNKIIAGVLDEKATYEEMTKAEYDALSEVQKMDGTMRFITDSDGDTAITKSGLGLGNVDNTSDINKPVSIAQRQAIDEKVDKQQGTANAGKVLKVGPDGQITTETLDPVLYDVAQSLTAAQQATARGNIDAADVGSVDDLRSVLDKTTEAMTVFPSTNVLNPDELVTGYISNTGSESGSSSYRHTGMIPVNTGETITAWRSVNNSFNTAVAAVNMRFICAYDNNLNVLSDKGSGSTVSYYVVEEGVAYIVVSIEAAYFSYDVAIYKQAITPTRIIPYVQEFYRATPDFLPTNYKAKPGYFSLYQATYTTELCLPEINVTKQVNIVFACRPGNNFTSVKVGNCVTNTLPGATYNSFITVNSTKVIFTINNSEYEFEHNLTITDYINISIHVRSDTKADVIVESGGGVYTRTIGWYGYGRGLYVARLVGSAIECYFTVALLDINADTYAFGDSYMAIIESPERWPHWLINAGFGNNVLFNACPGENSEQAIKAFQNIFTVGKPKYLLWALGMNDGADTGNTTPNTTWKTYVDYVLSICEQYGIVPILATIPTVPTINHEGKNAWIRSSGYRYIDFAKAVGAQSDGTWFTGMLSQDGVHPTELGAHALWNRVQIDFPEIMIIK